MLDAKTTEQVKKFLLCTEKVPRDGEIVWVGRHTRRSILMELHLTSSLHEHDIAMIREELAAKGLLPGKVIQWRGASKGKPFTCECGMIVQPRERAAVMAATKGPGYTHTRAEYLDRDRSDRSEGRASVKEGILAEVEAAVTTGGVVGSFREAKKIDPMIRLHRAMAECRTQVLLALNDLYNYDGDYLLAEFVGKHGTGVARSHRTPPTERLSGSQGKIAELRRLLGYTQQEIEAKGRKKREETRSGTH